MKAPIGIFDSGYGGLTILDAIRRELPQYDYLYLGDNARAPYGPRSFDVVYEFTRQAVHELFQRGCQLVILGCNTASAKALRTIQQRDLPQWDPSRRVLGVIRPTAEVIGSLTETRHVGIFATEGTIRSDSYRLEIQKLYPDITVTGGSLHITGQTNGMKSKGTLHVEGGSLWVIGGPKETKSALYSGGAFTITGGSIYALGCGVTEPDSGSSTQHSIAVKYSPPLDANSSAAIILNGTQVMWETSPYAFNTVFLSIPDISDGSVFSVRGNDEQYGDEYTVSGLNASAAVEKKPAEQQEQQPEEAEND